MTAMGQNTVQLIVLSRGEGLYEKVCREIGEEQMNASVLRAGSIREAAGYFRTGGVVVTDRDTLPLIRRYLDEDVRDVPPVPERGNAGDVASYIRYYVRMHLSEELNLEVLSGLIGLSRNYLCTLFHKETGVSLRRFIEKSRLEKAAYLLETEGSLVSEIAERVGIPNPSYFCKMFKKFYGESPREYRAARRMEKGD